jgi:hypothetical protein
MNALASASESFVFYEAFFSRKECVVTTLSNIPARMHFGSVLTNEDIAADDIFSAEFLDTEALPLAVTTIAG